VASRLKPNALSVLGLAVSTEFLTGQGSAG